LHYLYPTKILTVGDEVRTERLNRKMTQWDADDIVGTYRGFFNELEVGNRENTIYVLHKAYTFLGYVPTTLHIDENTPQGKLYAYRIKNGLPLRKVASEVGLDKSTISHFEKGGKMKIESNDKINIYINTNVFIK